IQAGLDVSPPRGLFQGLSPGGVIPHPGGRFSAGASPPLGARVGESPRRSAAPPGPEGGGTPPRPPAESSDRFLVGRERFSITGIVSIDLCCQLVRAQQAIGFRDRPLSMDPFWFDGVEPWAFAGQRADHDADTDRTPLDLVLVLAEPAPHRMAAVPRGIIPDQ